MSEPPTDKRRSRRPLYAVTAALLAVVLAGGAWFLLGRERPADCDALVKDDRVESALGSHHSTNMSCADLGTAMRVTTGGTAPHTRARAESMRKILLAVNDTLTEDDRPLAAEIRLPLAESLAGYANDTQEILEGTDSDYVRKVFPDSPAWEDETGYHFSVSQNDLVRVLRAVSEEPAAYAALRDAQTQWAATQLGQLTGKVSDSALTAPVVNASALAGYDAVAADVVRDKGASASAQWEDAVYAALRRPGAAVPRSALSDRIAEEWRASLASVPAEKRTDHLREQSTFMFTTWAGAVGMDRGRAKPVEEHCRRTGQDRYQWFAYRLQEL